jgi:transposase
MWERSLKVEKRCSQRAKVILLSGEGKSLKEISKIVGLSLAELSEMEEEV